MALRTYSVAVPATATKLSTLLQALAGWPTMTMLGITGPQPVGRSSQLTLQNKPANTGNIYVSNNPAVSATVGAGFSLIPGGSVSYGAGQEVNVDLSNIYVISDTAGNLLFVSIVD